MNMAAHEGSRGSADHSCAVSTIIEAAANASSLSDFQGDVAYAVASLPSVERATFFLGSPPRSFIEAVDSAICGFRDSATRRYTDGLFQDDPFRSARAARIFARKGLLRLVDLHSDLTPPETGYVKQFLHAEGVNDQHTVWINTAAHVHGYLSIFVGPGREITADVDMVLRDVTPTLANLLQLHLASGGMAALRPAVLSEAEQRIFDLAATGRSNHQIAAEAGLSVFTVKKHLTRIYRKTRVTSRGELIAMYAR